VLLKYSGGMMLCVVFIFVIRPKQCVSVIAVLYVFVLTGEQPIVDL